jgi:hypothetical protein
MLNHGDEYCVEFGKIELIREVWMRKVILSVMILAIVFALVPVNAPANTTRDCDRVGAYIDRVEGLIERASPIILRSGNERAIALLNSAVSEIRAANRAYQGDMCRVAYNHAQQAEQLVRRALRIIHHRRAD